MFADQDISRYEKEAMRAELHAQVGTHLHGPQQESWRDCDANDLKIGLFQRADGSPYVRMSLANQLWHPGECVDVWTVDAFFPRAGLIRASINECSTETRRSLAHHLLYKQVQKQRRKNGNTGTLETSEVIDGAIESIANGAMGYLEIPTGKDPENHTPFLPSYLQEIIFRSFHDVLNQNDQSVIDGLIYPADMRVGVVSNEFVTETRGYVHATSDYKIPDPLLPNRITTVCTAHVDEENPNIGYLIFAKILRQLQRSQREDLAEVLHRCWTNRAKQNDENNHWDPERAIQREKAFVHHAWNIAIGNVSI